jgi:hypothetical protein
MFKRAFVALALMASTAVGAATIQWTDWVAAGVAEVGGTIAAPGGEVTLIYSGPYSFAQIGCGTAYWDPGTYNGAFNKPPSCDIVALGPGGAKTITFDKPVTDPYMALMSWNGNTVVFSADFEVVSNGSGFWGSGTPIVNGDGDGFFGQGEVHAIIRFPGTFTSISFTDTSENWHGFTIGVEDVAGPGVPEPSTWAMLLLSLGLLAASTRRRAALHR